MSSDGTFFLQLSFRRVVVKYGDNFYNNLNVWKGVQFTMNEIYSWFLPTSSVFKPGSSVLLNILEDDEKMNI